MVSSTRAVGQLAQRGLWGVVVLLQQVSILGIVGLVVVGDVAQRCGRAVGGALRDQVAGRRGANGRVHGGHGPGPRGLLQVLLSPRRLVYYTHEGRGPRAGGFALVEPPATPLWRGDGRHVITGALIRRLQRDLHLLNGGGRPEALG